MEFSSIDQSRFAKYSLIIKPKNSRLTSRSEIEGLNVDENKTEQFVADYRNVKVADLLKLVGEDEKYQKTILFFLCLFNFAYAFIAFMIPYVFFDPSYLCFDQDKNKRLCSHAEACANPYGFETMTSITSVVSEFRLYCNRRNLIEVSEAIFVVSGGCAAFILGMLSDRFGRRRIFLLSYFLTVGGTLVSLLAPNLSLIVLGNILSWSGMDSFFSMVFIYVNEVIGSDLRSKANAFLFLSWGLGEIMINVVNIWITHYKVNFFIQFLPLTLLGVTYLMLQESPYLLYKLKNIGELYSSLKYIGIRNGRSEQFITQELDRRLAIDKVVQGNLEDIDSFRLKRLNPVKGGQFKGYLRYCHKLCKDKSIVWRLVGVTVITGNIYIGYSLSLLIPQRIGLSNIYLNGIFLGVSEIISYLIAIPIGSCVQRRHLNFMCALGIAILDVLLIVLDFTGESIDGQVLHWMQTMLSCLIKLVFCINYALIFNYCSELFPTKIRGLTLGICVFFGRFMVVFTFYLQMLTDHFQIHPMIGTIFGCIVVMPISLIMPETVSSGISN
jgi:MFS family permease